MTTNVARCLPILAVMLVFPMIARADLSTVSLGPAGIMDTWIGPDDDYPLGDVSHGGSWELRTNNRGSYDQRILIQFSDLSPLARAKTIESATLGLFWCDAWPDSSLTLEVHRILDPWDEDVTYSGSPSFQAAAVAASVAEGDPYKWVEWDVTSLVRKWVDGEALNYGMAIDGLGTEGYQIYASSENGDGLPVPRLDVAFVAVPVPASVLLGCLGLTTAGLKLRKLV